MNSFNSTGGLGIEGIVKTTVHDVEELQREYPEWQTFTTEKKMEATRNVSPSEDDVSYNITTDGLHEYFVDNLNPANTNIEANIDASHIALGTDGSSGTAETDTDLNNRVFSTEVTSHGDTGDELLCSTFLGSSEANGNTLDELGLFSGDPDNLASDDVFMLNHADFAGVTKDNSKTITFDVTLTFSDI